MNEQVRKATSQILRTGFADVRHFWKQRFGHELKNRDELMVYLVGECGYEYSDAENLTFANVAKLLTGPEPVVKLQGEGQPVIVAGVEQKKLTTKQYGVIKTLNDAGPDGLSLAKLVEKSGYTNGRKILKGIHDKTDVWSEAIIMAGVAHGRYCIKHV